MADACNRVLGIAQPNLIPPAVEPCPSQVWIEHESAINRVAPCIKIMSHIGQGVAACTHRHGIIFAQRYCEPSQSLGFGDFLRATKIWSSNLRLASLSATLSCKSKMSPTSPSKRSAQR